MGSTSTTTTRAFLVIEFDPAPGGGGVVVGETVTRRAANVPARQLAGTSRARALGLTFEVVEVDDERAVD